MISAFVSDWYNCRGLTLIFFSTLSMIGFSMFYGEPIYMLLLWAHHAFQQVLLITSAIYLSFSA